MVGKYLHWINWHKIKVFTSYSLRLYGRVYSVFFIFFLTHRVTLLTRTGFLVTCTFRFSSRKSNNFFFFFGFHIIGMPLSTELKVVAFKQYDIHTTIIWHSYLRFVWIIFTGSIDFHGHFRHFSSTWRKWVYRVYTCVITTFKKYIPMFWYPILPISVEN